MLLMWKMQRFLDVFPATRTCARRGRVEACCDSDSVWGTVVLRLRGDPSSGQMLGLNWSSIGEGSTGLGVDVQSFMELFDWMFLLRFWRRSWSRSILGSCYFRDLAFDVGGRFCFHSCCRVYFKQIQEIHKEHLYNAVLGPKNLWTFDKPATQLVLIGVMLEYF